MYKSYLECDVGIWVSIYRRNTWTVIGRSNRECSFSCLEPSGRNASGIPVGILVQPLELTLVRSASEEVDTRGNQKDHACYDLVLGEADSSDLIDDSRISS